MFGLDNIDIAVIGIYFAAMIYIGIRAMKHIRTQEDYFMGGRRFGKLVQIFTAFGQGTSADSAVGTTTTTYNNGAAGMWSSLLVIWATPIYWFTSPWYRRMRVLTMGDFFEQRYGSKRMAAFYAIISSLFLMSVIALGTKALSAAVLGMTQKDKSHFTQTELSEYDAAVELEALRQQKSESQLDTLQEERLQHLEFQKPKKEFSYISESILIWVIALVVLVYTVTGGLEAAMYTDMIQGMLIIILSIILIPFGLFKIKTVFRNDGILGAVHTMHERLPEYYFDIFGSAQSVDFTWYYIAAVSILGAINIVVQPNNMNAIGSAKDELTARIGFTLGSLLKRFCIILWGFFGLMAIVLYSSKIENSDYVWGYASRDLLGGLGIGLVGLMIACLMAALMSTADMMMITASGIITHNLYRPLLPNFNEEHYVKIGRISGTIILIGGAMVATCFDSILQMLKFLWEFNAILAAAFWCGMKWRRANRIGAWSSMLVTMLFFAFLPILLPVLLPSLRTNNDFLKQTAPKSITQIYTAHEMDVEQREMEIENWQKLRQQGKTEGKQPDPVSIGQQISKTIQPPKKSVFWSKGIKERNGIVSGQGLLYVEMVIIDRMFDLSKNSYALNETIRTLLRVILPFSVMIIVSLLTKPDDQAIIDRFYVKMRTPVTVDREIDKMEIEKSYANPRRFEENLLLPKLGLELFKWKKIDSIGFFAVLFGVFGIFGLLYLLLNVGA